VQSLGLGKEVAEDGVNQANKALFYEVFLSDLQYLVVKWCLKL
jgi:hypothetical protein